MQAATFWRKVTRDHADLLERTLHILEEAGAHYCVIDDQAVNAYAEPVVSLDLCLALAASALCSGRRSGWSASSTRSTSPLPGRT